VCPESGIAHLEWEMNLKNDSSYFGGTDDEAKEYFGEDYNKPTRQAIAAKEKWDLYLWWTVTRPNRPDPDEVSGYNELLNNSELYFDLDEPMTEHRKQAYAKKDELEQKYSDEDTEMLCRLMKIRGTLWT
jgi:hypothetical protein